LDGLKIHALITLTLFSHFDEMKGRRGDVAT